VLFYPPPTATHEKILLFRFGFAAKIRLASHCKSAPDGVTICLANRMNEGAEDECRISFHEIMNVVFL